MRLATSMLAALLASTSIATPVADACGGDYGPRAPAMFLVANHHGRTFVLLDKNVPSFEGVTFWRDTHSYDWAEIAAAPAFATAKKLTLVGSDRARRLSSANHVLVKPVFETRDAMNALEIFPKQREQARIAIAGEFTTVAWNEIQSQPVGLETAAWAQNPGFTPPLDPSTLSLDSVTGTNLELITAWTYSDGKSFATTYVRTPGAQPYGGYRGAPMAVVTLDGVRYLVLVDDGLVRPIAI